MAEAPKENKRVIKKGELPADPNQWPEGVDPADIPKHRRAMFMVDPIEFMFLFTTGLEFRRGTKILSGVPKDAKFIALMPDVRRQGVHMVLESASFKEIPINELPPIIPIKINANWGKQATKKKKAPRKKK